MKEIILASGSIYRKQLLQRLGITFECIPSTVDESPLKTSVLDPSKLAMELSKLKALDIYNNNPDKIIIGSDQVCYFNNEVLSKSGNKDKSIEILKKLSGQKHILATAYTIIDEQRVITKINETVLTMKELNEESIKRYVELDNPIDCAGSYKLELHGISLFNNIETTDQTAIIGLPLIELGKDLESLGIRLLA